MRDSKTFLSAVALVAALVVSAAAGGGPDRPHRRHSQGRTDDQPLKGATVTAENPQRVALVVHGDDRRQGPLLDHRPQDRHVEDHRVGAGLRALVRPGSGAQPRRADAAGGLRARPRRGRPGRRACRREHQGAAGRAAEGDDLANAGQHDAAIAAYKRSSPRRRR